MGYHKNRIKINRFLVGDSNSKLPEMQSHVINIDQNDSLISVVPMTNTSTLKPASDKSIF
jgi:hypothetical protein